MPRFNIEEAETHLRVSCPYEMQSGDQEEFGGHCRKLADVPQKIIIFDANQTPAAPQWFTRGLSLLQQSLKKKKATLFLANLSKEATKQIERAGLRELLNVKNTVHEALQASGIATTSQEVSQLDQIQMNVAPTPAAVVRSDEPPPLHWQGVLGEACLQAFTSHLSGSARFSSSQIETHDSAFESEVYAAVSFQVVQKRVSQNGALWLALPQAVLLHLYTAFTGEKAETLTPEVGAAARELADLLLQQVQALCQEQGSPVPQKRGHTSLLRGALPPLRGGKNLGFLQDIALPQGTFRIALRFEG